MTSGRSAYLKRRRKKKLIELMNNPHGIISLCFAAGAIILFAVAVIMSFVAYGEGTRIVGSLGMLGLVLAVGSVVSGIFAYMVAKNRSLSPRAGIYVGAVVIVVSVILIFI